MAEPLLRVTNLQVHLDHQVILDHVSFEINRNETLAIIGPNGAGKTVLFRALLGLLPYSGTIEWQKGIKIGYVPQKLSLDPDLPLTTAEFFRLKNKGLAQEEIETALKSVGFQDDHPHHHSLKHHILGKKIGTLSGGELQRVLVAWALAGNPDVLLFDEPTAGIDISAEETIYTLLHRLQAEKHLTILLISHELQVVFKYATQVVCLNKQAVCFGPPRAVLTHEKLSELYGKDTAYYQHH